MAGFSYGVCLIGLSVVRKNRLFIAILLFGSALLIPAYHIYKAELVSLDKHLGFSMFYVMPVAGYALASLSGLQSGLQRAFSYQVTFKEAILRTPMQGHGRGQAHAPTQQGLSEIDTTERDLVSTRFYWLSGVALCLILFLIGVHQAQDMYSSWPPTTQLTQVLNTQVRPANGRYLAEQFEVSRYNLLNDTYTWQWTGLDFFEYTNRQGHFYVGNEAYAKAINDGYFDLIQLNYGYNVQTALFVNKTIEQSKKYELIAKVPYHDAYGDGNFSVWRKR
jgi:hypothetical protein